MGLESDKEHVAVVFKAADKLVKEKNAFSANAFPSA